jgi:hypothetical protein
MVRKRFQWVGEVKNDFSKKILHGCAFFIPVLEFFWRPSERFVGWKIPATILPAYLITRNRFAGSWRPGRRNRRGQFT